MAGGKGKIRPEDNPKPFKKGENGGGYPKGVPNSKTRLKRLLSLMQEKKNPITGEMEGFSVIDQMDMAQILKALRGDTRAYKEIMDRFEGQARQSIDVNNEQPLTPPVIQVIQGLDVPKLSNSENDTEE